LALASCSREAASQQDGWRAATAADFVPLTRQVTDPDQPRPQAREVTADFDGDGKADKAAIMVNPSASRAAVFVFHGGSGRRTLVADYPLEVLASMELSVAKPGDYVTACARGLGDDGAPCKPKLHARWPAIEVAFLERGSEMYAWEGRRFVGEVISD
jgi:hypothetical protein